MKIELSDLNLPFKIRNTIYYVDNKLKKVIELTVMSYQISAGAILVNCLIKDNEIRRELGNIQMGLNLKIEQNVYTNIEGAYSYLKRGEVSVQS